MKAAISLLWYTVSVAVLLLDSSSFADEASLAARIDQRLAPTSGLEVQLCSDGEFLRRVSLDLTGMPPTADQARQFLVDPSPDKRVALVDKLLAAPEYARHLATTLDVMLMERRGYTQVTVDEWQAWLLKSVQENKPWNSLVRELLAADGADPAMRAAARFTLDRTAEPHLLTRDIGRIFFGRDLQCAQCHDHPIVDDYLQADYHGLLAYIAPSYAQVVKEGDKDKTVLAEKAGTDFSFESVFIEGTMHRTGPRMPAAVAIEEPFFLPGDEYQTAPAANTKSIPKFSRRSKLAELATDGTNLAFNENIANRLWAHMFGRGLVHPLDWHHADNPASDPELLRLLAADFAEHQFDIKYFLRELALTRVYQRAFDPPLNASQVAEQARQQAAALEQKIAEQQPLVESAKTAYYQATDAWYKAEATALPVAAELDAARTQYANAKTKLDEAQAAVAAANAQLAAKQQVVASVQAAATAAQQAAQAVADDAELTAAAQKFVGKSEQLVSEAAALMKTVEEKQAGLQMPSEALQQAQPPVEAAVGKLAPLQLSLRQAEQAMLTARNEAATQKSALQALQQRAASVTMLVQLPELQQAISTAQMQLEGKEGEVALAMQHVTEYGAELAKAEGNLQQATSALTAAREVVAGAEAMHRQRSAQEQSIMAATTAAEAALGAVPDDALLAEVANKLKERLGIAVSASGETQQQVEQAKSGEAAAAAAQAAAEQGLAAANAERQRREQALAASQASLASAQADVVQQQAARETAAQLLTARWTNDFTVASLKPLTPEQLCWSVFRVTGVYDRYWQTEVAELDKTTPLSAEQLQDAGQLAARQVVLEQRTFDKLKGNVAAFVTYYAAGAGQPQGDFFSTADQALFVANGGSINSWCAPAGDNVTDRIIKQTDSRMAAEELYLGLLTRMPTETEVSEVASYLEPRAADRAAAAQELVWAILNSAEFRFNH